MKNNKFLKLFYGIFALVGIGMLAGAVVVFLSSQKFMSEAEEVSGVIETIETYRDSDNDVHHRAYVSYTYNGREYDNVRLSFYSSNMYEGKSITLYCDPNDPGRVVAKEGNLFACITLLFMGIIFSCVGIIPTIVLICRNTKHKKIRESGKMLYATVEKIDCNTSYTVNGRHPYVIFCNYRDDYRDITYRFKSENLWSNPEPAITIGSAIKVYVEENNYKNYYVDAESMIQGKIVDYT